MLILWNLKALVCRHRRFLIPMLVTFLTSVMGVLMLQNLVIYIADYNAQWDEDTRTYVLPTDSATLEAGLPALRSRSDVARVQVTMNGQERPFYAIVSGTSRAAIGKYFTAEGLRQGLEQVVLPEDEARERRLHVGDTYELNGQTFTVIGFQYLSVPQVPYMALRDRSGVCALSVATKKDGTPAERAAFAAFLQQTFHVTEDDMQLPPTLERRRQSSESLLFGGVMLLGVCSMACLYVFYLESRRRTFAVYTMVGCRRGRMIRLLGGETLLLVAGMYGLSVLATKVLLWGLSSVGDVFVERLEWMDYLLAFGLSCGMASVVLLWQLWRFFRKTPNERRRAR